MSDFDDKVASVELIFNHTFSNKVVCAAALQMAAPQAFVSINGVGVFIENNQRLSVLGDAVMAGALCHKWYQAGQSKETWTTARAEVLGNVALFQRGTALGIGALIYTNPGHWGESPSAKMVATTFEALFGAIYQDGGEAAVIKAVEHLGLDNHPSLMIPNAGALRGVRRDRLLMPPA